MSQMPNTGAIPAFELNDRLGRALRHAHVGVQEMADYLDVSRNTIGNYLSGRTPPPRSAVIAWALKCGVDFHWLLTGEAKNPPGPKGPGGNRTKGATPEPIGSVLHLATRQLAHDTLAA